LRYSGVSCLHTYIQWILEAVTRQPDVEHVINIQTYTNITVYGFTESYNSVIRIICTSKKFIHRVKEVCIQKLF